MAEQQLEPQIEIKPEEKAELLQFFEKLDLQMLKNTAEAISMFVRAFEGEAIEPSDIIRDLINVRNIIERSNFPSYPVITRQVYLRLVAKYNKNYKAYEDWMDIEAQALKSYKGKSTEQYVEIAKAKMASEAGQNIIFGTQVGKAEEKKKPGRLARLFGKGKEEQGNE